MRPKRLIPSLCSARAKAVFAACAGLVFGDMALSLEFSSENPPVIVRNPEASLSEIYAAEELSTYLGKILETEVPIVVGAVPEAGPVPIIVGRHPANAGLLGEAAEAEEAVVEVSGNQIRVAGGFAVGKGSEKRPQHDRGTLYAAYDLLEEIGVRWYRPEDWGEYVPRQKSVVLTEGRRKSRPAFRYRYGINHYQTYTPFPSQVDNADELAFFLKERDMVIRWAVRNRQNTNIFSDDERYRGEYNVNFAHAYGYLVPQGKYFKEHPEYYALINGERSSDPFAQLCLGNPEVEKVVFEEILETFKRNPNLEIASLDPNDFAHWCECDLCRAMDDPQLKAGHSGKMPESIKGISMANRVTEFNNRIARRLREVLPEKRVGWYAYAMHTEVPTKVEKLEPNTAVMPVAFAGSFSDYSRGLYDPKSAQNKRFLEILKGYRDLADKSGALLFAHDYWSFYSWPGPLPVLKSMHDKLRNYHRDFGITGVYNETHPCWGPQGMILYFYTWLLRNPEGNLEAEKKKYYENFYGPAASAMADYHETLENAAWGGPYFGSGGSEIERLFTGKLIQELRRKISAAEEAVKGAEPYDRRVAGVAAGLRYAELVREFLDLKEQGKAAEAAAKLDELQGFFNSFVDGSVFDNRRSVRGNWDNMVFDKYRSQVEKEAKMKAHFLDPRVVQLHDRDWRFRTDPDNHGRKEKWQGEVDDSQWAVLRADQPWQSQGFGDYQGVGWYRRSFRPPVLEDGRRMILYFEAVDGDTEVYLNGRLLGSHRLGPDLKGWDEPFYFDITDVVKPGEANQIALRVEKDKFVGGLTNPVRIVTVEKIRPPE